ncbi:hypothetical protein M9Y10_025144 [Tritrichomonas musculus]|uniref:Protein kinase domain-containing protein n=1 Tax=Tritrichomonas musculus TaxID=1915356 RepID=A0ABR2HAM0_9EUKA
MNQALTIDSNFDFTQPIQDDKFYECNFFGNLEIPLVLTSTNSNQLNKIIDYLLIRPIVSVRFYVENSITYFCFCCQNLCCIIKALDGKPILKLLDKMRSYFLICLTPQDSDYIKSLKINFRELSEKQMNEIQTESANIDMLYFNQLNLQLNSSNFTFSKYLAITHTLISIFYIRRNYFPVDKFTRSIPIDFPTHSEIEQYTQNDFCFLRTIQTDRVKLCIEKKRGLLCVVKNYPDRSIFEKELERIKIFKIHPNIVNCLGYIDDDPSSLQPSLIFEFESFTSLDQIFENKVPLDGTMKTRILYQILAGIDILHSKGYVCSNLLPKNILISSSYDVSLTHLSECRVCNPDGTFEPKEGLSFRDVMGLYGMIIYELVYMQEVWDRNLTGQERLDYINQNVMPQLPIELGSIVELYEKCIRNEPDSRISSFYYLTEFMNYFYYFNDAELDHLLWKNYEDQLIQASWKDLRSDVLYYITKSNQNDVESLYLLGIFYRDGMYYKKDVKTAKRKFEQTLNYTSNCNEAIYELIVQSFDGIDNCYNKQMCFKSLEYLCSQPGNFKAKFFYAKYVIESPAGFTDEERNAAINLMVEIRNNSADAQTYMGNLMLNGQIFQKDEVSAFNYFVSASRMASSEAVLRIAMIYENGIENAIQKDPSKALAYYFLAASLRNETAVQIIIDKYKSLEFSDQVKANKLLKISAEQQITPALKFVGFQQRELASNKESGESNEKRQSRMVKAMKYLSIAADKNDMDCLIEVANEYYFHKNIEQNVEKATRYYQTYKNLGGSQVIRELENNT